MPCEREYFIKLQQNYIQNVKNLYSRKVAPFRSFVRLFFPCYWEMSSRKVAPRGVAKLAYARFFIFLRQQAFWPRSGSFVNEPSKRALDGGGALRLKLY